MSKRVRLIIIGLSYSQLQSGAYALILGEEGGNRRIPVVIGAAEAQSIAIALEGIRTPRPLTHDLFVSFAHTFGVKLREVYIYRFEDGIFSAELCFSDGERTVTIDARTSDAIALALRTGAPVYTTPEIVEQTGFIINEREFTRPGELDEADLEPEEDDQESAVESRGASYQADARPENYSIEQLEITLAELIDKEEYEEAERISAILQKKKDAAAGKAPGEEQDLDKETY